VCSSSQIHNCGSTPSLYVSRAVPEQVVLLVVRVSTEPGLTPLWTAIKKLDVSGVKRAADGGADLNERDAQAS
jgi:hypothetical protein